MIESMFVKDESGKGEKSVNSQEHLNEKWPFRPRLEEH
jgi:hypothetical protein